MTQITKPTNFFKRYHQVLIGIFWLFGGIVSFILQEGVIFYLYAPLGLGLIIYGYLSKNKIGEFIAWDDTKIVIKDLTEGEKVFSWNSIDNIFISNNHLTVKSGPAGGIILDLAGYEKKDVDLLQKHLTPDIISA